MEKVKNDSLTIMALAKEISQELGSSYENALTAVGIALSLTEKDNRLQKVERIQAQ
jgi:hypothetical protein